ncbi:tripartite tricarboxylate transporter TctB family protein [Oscillospiraceae bacterium LTW-04]|nr:tripartite tricarboxylate transporter TctB family protein [Oscillospiraceae bacterium MB24-C1]
MTNKKKNIIVSVMFMAFGAFLFVESLGIKHMMKNDVGSGFFPKVISVAIIVVSAIRLIMALRENTGEKKASNDDKIGGLLTILLIGAYVLAFNTIGFLISTAAYLFLQMLVLTPEEKRNLPLLAGLAISAPILIYVLFVYVINTPLPKGVFGF